MTRASAPGLLLVVGAIAQAGAAALWPMCAPHPMRATSLWPTGKFKATVSTVGVTPDMLEALSWLARGDVGRQTIRSRGRLCHRDAAALARRAQARRSGRRARWPRPWAPPLRCMRRCWRRGASARKPSPISKTEMATWHGSPLADPHSEEHQPADHGRQARARPWTSATGWERSPLSLAALKGHPVLLFFWAHWCGDCKAEVPILARLMQTYGPKGLVLVGAHPALRLHRRRRCRA